MTSPQAATSDVVAAMATTEIDEPPPTIELTAGEEHSQVQAQAEVKAIVEVEQQSIAGTISPEENKDKDSEYVGENVGEGQTEKELSHPADDAAIQQPEEGAIPLQEQQPELPPHMLDYSQMDPIASILAYANPYDLPQHGMNDLALPIPMDPSMMQQPYLDPSPYIHENENARISAYAKIEFEDGEFYMNTYQMILGRDQSAARDALRREAQDRRRIDEEASASRDPKTPVRIKREESRYSRSAISESGGILREGDDPPPEADREERRRRRKASKKSKSTGSSSHHLSRRNSLVQPNGVFNYQIQPQVRHYAPDTTGAAPVDPATLRPSPYDCPVVGIHPPGSTPAQGHKAISRAHVKIAYSEKKRLFEAIILGRNGAFIDDEFYHHKNVIPLKSGSRLQIGGVVARFVLPDVAIGETGAEQKGEYDENHMSERYSEGGKEMSFDFEDTLREGAVEDTSEDSSNPDDQDDEDGQEDEAGLIGDEVDEEDDLESSDQSQVEDDDGEEVDENAEILPEESPKSERKRGPGRPPKNGIMSKREEQLARKEAAALAQKQAQQKPKKTISQPQAGPTPGKNKVGRPRKHPRPDTPPVQREKRKYTKRKPKEPKEGEGKEEGSGGEEAKEKKEKKPVKPPRSPSPQFNEADLTPDQLAKPQANYVTLIHEALSNSPAGQMSLPQIYRAIMRKYPFFVLKCSTNGWQSSVRHNLSQHSAFTKVERDGKGWMWAIVEGVPIEKEKKRRTTPPPQLPSGHMHHQPIYQAGHPPHMMSGPYGPGTMAPLPGYPINHPMNPNIRPGQHHQYIGPPTPVNGHPFPPGPQPQMNCQPPPQGYVASIPQLAPTSGPQQYSSPYAPKPATSAPPQPQFNEHRPPSEQQPFSAPGPPASTVPQQPPQQQQLTQSQQPQQPKQVTSTTRPQHPPSVLNAVEAFRNNFMPTFKSKSDNAEAIVASAVNRVLGYMHQSAVPGDPFEDQIISALMSVLGQVPEFMPNPHLASARSSNQQNDQRSPQLQANQNGTQRSASQQPPKSTGSEKSAPTVMRPSFTGGPSRPNGPSLPRPPMMTPGMKRANSDSPAPPRPSGPSSASPAPAPSGTNGASNGASTPIMSASENGQIAGQKRPLEEDAEGMREFKRMSTSGPPQLKT